MELTIFCEVKLVSASYCTSCCFGSRLPVRSGRATVYCSVSSELCNGTAKNKFHILQVVSACCTCLPGNRMHVIENILNASFDIALHTPTSLSPWPASLHSFSCIRMKGCRSQDETSMRRALRTAQTTSTYLGLDVLGCMQPSGGPDLRPEN